MIIDTGTVIESKLVIGKIYTTRANIIALSKHNIRQGFCCCFMFFSANAEQ